MNKYFLEIDFNMAQAEWIRVNAHLDIIRLQKNKEDTKTAASK